MVKVKLQGGMFRRPANMANLSCPVVRPRRVDVRVLVPAGSTPPYEIALRPVGRALARRD